MIPSVYVTIDPGALPRIGDSAADLVYTPVAPCRSFDTRTSGGIIAAGTERNFYVAGGCNVPYGPATAVMINLTAVDPVATGNLKAWAVWNPQTAAPSAAICLNKPSMVAAPSWPDTWKTNSRRNSHSGRTPPGGSTAFMNF